MKLNEAKQVVSNRHYFVLSGSVVNGHLGHVFMSTYPVAHASYDEAHAEAGRLAAKAPGKMFIVAQFHSGQVINGLEIF